MCSIAMRTVRSGTLGVRNWACSRVIPAQDPRVGDVLFPLWNLLDMTREGRGTGWYPSIAYDRSSGSMELCASQLSRQFGTQPMAGWRLRNPAKR